MKYIVRDNTNQQDFEFGWFKEAETFFYEYRHDNSFSHVSLLKVAYEGGAESVLATYYPD